VVDKWNPHEYIIIMEATSQPKETAMKTLTTTAGLRLYDPMYSEMYKSRVRVYKIIDEVTVEVTDNDGKLLPDWCHVSQLRVWG
jgi:hypothetical protein